MKNMTLAFLATLTLAVPVAHAESKIVDQTEQNRHLNTKDLFDAKKPLAEIGSPMAPMGTPAAKGTNANADSDFARSMISHHQSGINMAKGELANGKDPEMKKLAHSIIDAQSQEIDRMNQWLEKHK